MKYKGRQKSKNVIDIRTNNWEGRANSFLQDSFALAAANYKPGTKFKKNVRRSK